MSEAGHSREDAMATAEAVVALLSDSCERIEIAGSLRRGAERVKDIEIVAEPKYGLRNAGLFDEPELVNLLEIRVEALLLRRWLHLRRIGEFGQRNGPRYKALDVDYVPVDLFIVMPPAQWGLILAIRTGPAEFSRRLVTPTSQGGLMPHGWRVKNGRLHDHAMRPLEHEVNTEADLFDLIGRPDLLPVEARLR